jgi:hypothetical protein
MRFIACAILVLVIMALAPSAPAQQALPLAPHAKVIPLNSEPGYFNEPAIAVNPNNPRQVVAAFQVSASVAYSEDAGEHWQLAGGTAPENYKTSGDVSITYDTRGHALLCYIAFDKLGTLEYWAHNATRNGIFVRRSLDGGRTWEKDAVAVDEQPTRPVMPFEDKPYIVADNNPGSPYAGNLYIGWTEFSLTKTIILYSGSSDGGATWSAPAEISTHEGLPRDDNGSVEGFAGAVAADGTLYAVWADGNSIVLAVSSDGGRTFAPSRNILDVAPPYFKVTAVERSNGFPQIGIDPRTSRLYVTWTDYRNGDVDVFCSTSTDRGATWSPPLRVNDDPLHNGADQFFQWLAVDPADGSANVIFYDRRDDPANRSALIVLARSTDGGATFRNYAWTKTPFDPKDEFIGDYTGIAAFQGRVYGVWTEKTPPSKPSPKPADATTPAQSKAAPAPKEASHFTLVKIGVADFQPVLK